MLVGLSTLMQCDSSNELDGMEASNVSNTEYIIIFACKFLHIFTSGTSKFGNMINVSAFR